MFLSSFKEKPKEKAERVAARDWEADLKRSFDSREEVMCKSNVLSKVSLLKQQ